MRPALKGSFEVEQVLTGTRRWCVLQADCLEFLPQLQDRSIDHVITDPPYARGLYLRFRTNRSGVRDRPTTKAFTALANEQIGAAEDVAEPTAAQFARLARRWILVFHDAESGHLWRDPLKKLHVRCGVWVKPNPMPQISGDRPGMGFEALEIAHAPGRKRWNGGGLPAVWTHLAIQGNWPERAGNDHPCPKPLSLMQELVAQFTDQDEVVLDPFCGSGTTGVACVRLGRRFIGVERDKRFAQLARERIEAESRGGLSLVDTRAGQIGLFEVLR